MSNPYQEALGATLIERTFRERIVLVGVTLGGHTDEDTEEGLDELSLLVDTAGADEAARLTQRRDTPDSAFYIGKGKVEELKEVCLALDADTGEYKWHYQEIPAEEWDLDSVQQIMLADIEATALAEAVKGLEERQIRAAGVLCDVAHRAALQAAAEKTLETFGKVHVVCNNAGVAVGGPSNSVGHAGDGLARADPPGGAAGGLAARDQRQQQGRGQDAAAAGRVGG